MCADMDSVWQSLKGSTPSNFDSKIQDAWRCMEQRGIPLVSLKFESGAFSIDPRGAHGGSTALRRHVGQLLLSLHEEVLDYYLLTRPDDREFPARGNSTRELHYQELMHTADRRFSGALRVLLSGPLNLTWEHRFSDGYGDIGIRSDSGLIFDGVRLDSPDSIRMVPNISATNALKVYFSLLALWDLRHCIGLVRDLRARYDGHTGRGQPFIGWEPGYQGAYIWIRDRQQRRSRIYPPRSLPTGDQKLPLGTCYEAATVSAPRPDELLYDGRDDGAKAIAARQLGNEYRRTLQTRLEFFEGSQSGHLELVWQSYWFFRRSGSGSPFVRLRYDEDGRLERNPISIRWPDHWTDKELIICCACQVYLCIPPPDQSLTGGGMRWRLPMILHGGMQMGLACCLGQLEINNTIKKCVFVGGGPSYHPPSGALLDAWGDLDTILDSLEEGTWRDLDSGFTPSFNQLHNCFAILSIADAAFVVGSGQVGVLSLPFLGIVFNLIDSSIGLAAPTLGAGVYFGRFYIK